MKILSVNAGSSSLKFQMYEMPEEKVLISGVFEKIGMAESFYTIKINGEKVKKMALLDNHTDAVKILIEELLSNNVITSLDEIKGVGHRVVHGGSKYSSSIIINEDVIDTIESLSSLAPLHNPANLMGIRAFMKELPSAISVAVFDTAFHQTMPEESFIYALPYEWYTKNGIRRYGFHGISHDYLTETLKKELDNDKPNLITCHLGNGASISAIKDGVCFDTSLGFSPNSGLMMGTRSGDIDCAIIPYIMKEENLSLNEVMNILNKKSGYLGVSGISNDSRDIEAAADQGNERAKLSQVLFVNRIVEYIAKYYVKLGHVDAICFAGGIGENSMATREAVMNKLAALGVKIDNDANNVRGEFKLISASDSKIPVYIIPTDEEVMIARDTYNFI
ncbi:MAG: acetate kinase [Bacilli bacterium]|nr:acetate kinase [Bacilli bacterium]